MVFYAEIWNVFLSINILCGAYIATTKKEVYSHMRKVQITKINANKYAFGLSREQICEKQKL